ncbi:hypothetical protein ACIQU4_15755 [Streptomyces sp. NPDC090741]|uniref:hypothetical protein n=1 Tax=Streptomyces sp. NPDC090741 TaxID=3365967 RepID=UPI00380405D3
MASSIVRAARAYWRFNERVWLLIRRATVPLLVVGGIASVALWAIGVARDSTPLQWAPAVYAWVFLISFQLARSPR